MTIRAATRFPATSQCPTPNCTLAKAYRTVSVRVRLGGITPRRGRQAKRSRAAVTSPSRAAASPTARSFGRRDAFHPPARPAGRLTLVQPSIPLLRPVALFAGCRLAGARSKSLFVGAWSRSHRQATLPGPQWTSRPLLSEPAGPVSPSSARGLGGDRTPVSDIGILRTVADNPLPHSPKRTRAGRHLRSAVRHDQGDRSPGARSSLEAAFDHRPGMRG